MPDLLEKFRAKFNPDSDSHENEEKETESGEPELFKSILEAWRFLDSKGYKIKKSAVYNARKRGEIKVNPDGSVTRIAIMAYAAGLKKVGGQEELLETAERKSRAELRKIEEQTKAIILDREIKEGKFIQKDEAIINRVDQLLIVDVNIRNLIDTNIVKWCQLLAGKTDRINDCKAVIHSDLDEVYNALATSEAFLLEEVG